MPFFLNYVKHNMNSSKMHVLFFCYIYALHALTANHTACQSYEWTLYIAWGFFVSQYLFLLFTFLLNQPHPHTKNIFFPWLHHFKFTFYMELMMWDIFYKMATFFCMTKLQKYTTQEHSLPLNTYNKCSTGTWVSVNKSLA